MTPEAFIYTLMLIFVAFIIMSAAVWVWDWIDAHPPKRHCFYCAKPIPRDQDFCAGGECAKEHFEYQRCEKRRYDKEY